MFKWLKRRNCSHDYEIITKGFVKIIPRSYNTDLIEFYHITNATCVTCGLKKELDKEKVDKEVTHGKLLKVHKDPKHIYDWFRKEEALNELRSNR